MVSGCPLVPGVMAARPCTSDGAPVPPVPPTAVETSGVMLAVHRVGVAGAGEATSPADVMVVRGGARCAQAATMRQMARQPAIARAGPPEPADRLAFGLLSGFIRYIVEAPCGSASARSDP